MAEYVAVPLHIKLNRHKDCLKELGIRPKDLRIQIRRFHSLPQLGFDVGNKILVILNIGPVRSTSIYEFTNVDYSYNEFCNLIAWTNSLKWKNNQEIIVL